MKEKLAYISGTPESPGNFVRVRHRRSGSARESERRQKSFQSVIGFFEDVIFGFPIKPSWENDFCEALDRGLRLAHGNKDVFAVLEHALFACNALNKRFDKRGHREQARVLQGISGRVETKIRETFSNGGIICSPFLSWYAGLDEREFSSEKKRLFLKGLWCDQAKRVALAVDGRELQESARFASQMREALAHPISVVKQSALEALPECLLRGKLYPTDFVPVARKLARGAAAEVSKTAAATKAALTGIRGKELQRLMKTHEKRWGLMFGD